MPLKRLLPIVFSLGACTAMPVQSNDLPLPKGELCITDVKTLVSTCANISDTDKTTRSVKTLQEIDPKHVMTFSPATWKQIQIYIQTAKLKMNQCLSEDKD